MISRRSALACVVVVGSLVGCGERVEAGLANAPSLERHSDPRNPYDVVSNGDEGCDSRHGGGTTVASGAGACPKGGVTAVIIADAAPDSPAR